MLLRSHLAAAQRRFNRTSSPSASSAFHESADMDLQPTDDQLALIEMVTGFASDRFPIDIVRSFGEPNGFDRDRWKELAALGTFGLALPETEGGVGLDFIDAVLVHEALGKALLPGPLLAATLSAGLVDGVLDGSVLPAIVDIPHDGPIIVEHFRSSDVLLMVDDDGVRVAPSDIAEGIDVVRSTDPTSPISILETVPAGELIGGPELAVAWRQRGSLLASAQLSGNSIGSTELAVAYAKEREQFGRPIGSFQGLKHLLADSWIRSEVARSSVWAAGVMVDEPDVGSVTRAVAGARLTSSRAATENAKTCLQVHGGMGFTWEVDAHLFLKRAWVLETVFGTCDEAAEDVANLYAGL
ncbi:MAG: acyl-CoA dehydrogenase [Actinobacteria bacterium]|nr:acyl-CoA dehydrogenase [Actinomycetota bacterium]MSY34624.1 acyl-CoA dehydrogenase [Actinomycetota bacterium]MTA43070.1 acyl-CoA dehydrogenase [Actinomycetota bacterium]